MSPMTVNRPDEQWKRNLKRRLKEKTSALKEDKAMKQKTAFVAKLARKMKAGTRYAISMMLSKCQSSLIYIPISGPLHSFLKVHLMKLRLVTTRQRCCRSLDLC